MQRAVLIHGWEGYPEEGWRPWLTKELEAKGFEVFVPAMPDTNHPRPEAWLEHLQKIIGPPDSDCILVGHSLGCPTILQYLQRLTGDEVIGAAIMVAGFFEHIDDDYEEIKPFVAPTLDWDAILAHCRRFAVIHSDDDTVVPLPYAERLAEHLGVSVRLQHGYGHFSGSDGIDTAPCILQAIESIS